MKSLDAAKLPAGLLLAAALIQFAPAFATPVAFIAYSVAAYAVSALNLKGASAIAGAAVVVVLIQAWITDTGVQPLRDAAEVVEGVEVPNVVGSLGGRP